MSSEITLSELMAEYRRLNIGCQKDSDGLTVAEWSEQWSVTPKRAREVIAKFSNSGWVTVGRKTARAIDGRACLVPVYKIEVPESAETKKTRPKREIL